MDATPKAAEHIVSFGDAGGAAVLRYNLPLPGRITGGRLVRLDVGLSGSDFKRVSAPGRSALQTRLELNQGPTGYTYNVSEVLAYMREQFDTVIDPMQVPIRAVSIQFATWATQKNNAATNLLEDLSSQENYEDAYKALVVQQPWQSAQLRMALEGFLRQVLQWYNQFRSLLASGVIPAIKRVNPASYTVVPTTPPTKGTSGSAPSPAFYLIETYGISTFLGDYGLGRTLATYSLLPGEETKIYIKTWRTDTVTSKEATSIIDSYTNEAADSHKTDVQDETTSKRTKSDAIKWHVDAEVKAKWGWGDAKVTGGAAGDHQTGREEFARAVETATKEHAFKASSNRSNTVSTERTNTTTTGEERSTERTIKNINLRRVLNFVFRELTQDYVTKVHLIRVRVAFSDGPSGVWDEVDLPQLRHLIDRYVKAGRAVDTAAHAILKAIFVAMDHKGDPVTCIERVNAKSDGSISVQRATLGTNSFLPTPPDDSQWMYRFKAGPLKQSGVFTVDGVCVRAFNVTMRTESIVCEALLGQADALDPYAVAQQYEDVQEKRLRNERTALAIKTLEAITDPETRAKSYAAIFNPPTDSAGPS